MIIEPDIKLDFSDVLFEPRRSTLSSRKDVVLEREYTFKHSQYSYSGIPIIAANMDTIGTFDMATELTKSDISTALHKHYPVDDLVTYFDNSAGFHFYSLGIMQDDLIKFQKFYDSTQGNFGVCIDVANGYSEKFVDFIKRFRENYPNLTIMAGNVVTSEMTHELIISGVDIVKIGIGSGSVCTTRRMTGVGYPQLSAIIECADAAHGLGAHICSDGGCVVPGDIAKAFGANADFVMLGGMFAGHDECNGELSPPELPTHMTFYGMSSKTAQDKHNDGLAEYRSSEGRTVMVPYRGPVELTISKILGGLRSTCTYVGAKTLKDLPKCTRFIRVNNQLNQSLERYDTGKD